MTQVRMYVGVADRLRLLYRLLSRHIVPRGMRAFVLAADEEEAERTDTYLWTAAAGEFLPHARTESDAAEDSPAVIGAAEPAADFRADILVSWSAEAPSFFGRFAHLADISENRPPEMRAARARYKLYESRGCPIDVHKMNE